MTFQSHEPVVGFAAIVIRTPIEVPVRTSFGTMSDRPALMLRVSDGNGLHGYGEVWCNFPFCGADHRLRLAREVVGPVLTELHRSTTNVYDALMGKFHILAIQSGEWGPLRQVAAGFDAAVHDLRARQAGLPLYRYLNDNAKGQLKAYASGIGPEEPAEMAKLAIEKGHDAFKLKVGFGKETDLNSLDSIRRVTGEFQLMIDANQGWTLDQAIDFAELFDPYQLTWLEEPMAADRPMAEWRELAKYSKTPLAAGENCNHIGQFMAMMKSDFLSFIQPDVAKWGGVSGCFEVAQHSINNKLVFCPHFLGSGIGLMTSAHILAAQQDEGMLEMDINPNPLRDEIVANSLKLHNGKIRLNEDPGIGLEIDNLF